MSDDNHRPARLAICPVAFGEANAFIRRHHRHRLPVTGYKYALGAVLSGRIIGVVVVGRPVSRLRQDGATLEITRLATDGRRYPTGRFNRLGEPTFHNAASFLLGAAARACFALGYRRIGTYTVETEPGTSLVAASFKLIGRTEGRSWNRPSRPRVDTGRREDKLLWERESAG